MDTKVNKEPQVYKDNKVNKEFKAYKDNKAYKVYKVAPEHKEGLATKDYGPKPKPIKTVILYNGTTNYGPSYAYPDKLAGKACQMASSPQTFINFEANRDNKETQEHRGFKVFKGYKGYKAYKETSVHKA